MVIGIPKAFLYYRYGKTWRTFFRSLGCTVLVSPDTNRELVEHGCSYSIDENCLPLKIFLGHVHWLLDRCDYILVPRFTDMGKNEEFCVTFFGLYDLVRHTFTEAKLIGYDLNISRGQTELAGFLQMGRSLGKTLPDVYSAYCRAKEARRQEEQKKIRKQARTDDAQGQKILIASQSYISHDQWLGKTVARLICEQGATPLYSDAYEGAPCRREAEKFSSALYWTLNKEIAGAVSLYCKDVDGVILLTAFPCGTDCLVNELLLRRIKDVPMIQIVLDEQQGEAGLRTRIESFLDLIEAKKEKHA